MNRSPELREVGNIEPYAQDLVRFGFTSTFEQGRAMVVDTLRSVGDVIPLRSFHPGHEFFHQSDVSSSLIFLISGHVKLFTHNEYTGRNRVSELVDPVSVFGEEVFRERRRKFSAVALTDGTFYDISIPELIVLQKQIPHIWTIIRVALDSRSDERHEREYSWSARTVSQNVAKAILDILDRPALSWSVLNQESVGELASTTRESAQRAIADLQARGLLWWHPNHGPQDVNREALKRAYER